MRRCAVAVTYAAVGMSDAYLVVPPMNQHVAFLMNGNLASCDEGRLLCGMTGGDAAVAFAANRPFLAAPRDDVLIFTHGDVFG